MDLSTGWWTTFFEGLAVESWLRFERLGWTEPEVDFIAKSLDLAPGASVLDVPCGGGRHALGLASRGFRVVGVDLSQGFLAEARRRKAEQGLAVDFEERDMRDLPWQDRFDGAYCFGNSFAYLDDDGNRQFLEAVHAALRPGGRFVLETGVVAESILGSFEARAWYQEGDMYCLAERKHDPFRSRLEVEYTFIQGGRIEKREASYRVYTVLELVRLLAAVGLTVTGHFSGVDGTPYTTGSQGLIVVCKK